jgi:hypothetical protein
MFESIDIGTISSTIAWVFVALCLIAGIIWSIRKVMKSGDKQLLEGTIQRWLYDIFSVVEGFFDGEKTGALKFEAAKKLIIDNDLFPAELKRLIGSPEFEEKTAEFIETNLRKAQAIWEVKGHHKPLE